MKYSFLLILLFLYSLNCFSQEPYKHKTIELGKHYKYYMDDEKKGADDAYEEILILDKEGTDVWFAITKYDPIYEEWFSGEKEYRINLGRLDDHLEDVPVPLTKETAKK